MGSRMRYTDKRRGIDKIISFDPNGMLGWSSMFRYTGTVFEIAMVRVMLVSTIVLGFVVFAITTRLPFASDPDFNTDHLSLLVKFMMTFLAFMVSIFVNGAFSRWVTITGQLSSLLQLVKMIYVDLVMHNVPRAAINDIRRWGVASVWLTAEEAPSSWTQPQWPEVLLELQTAGLLNEEEKEMLLARPGDKSPLMWVWITMKLRELSENQFVPARATPALTRMLDHCHMAMSAISHIFNSILLQIPHQYMHMLAFLINLLNIVNTVKCGIELGSLYSKSTDTFGHFLTAMEIQAIVEHLGIMLFCPLVYQSFLCISVDIMIPFGDGSTDIPIHYLLNNLMSELSDFDDSVRARVAGSESPSAITRTLSKGTASERCDIA